MCHASLEEIREVAGKLTGPHFPSGEGAPQVRFAVAYEHRASVELARMDVINAIVDQIPQARSSCMTVACNQLKRVCAAWMGFLLTLGTSYTAACAKCSVRCCQSHDYICITPPFGILSW